MKFKERRGNVFVFDGGYDRDELELVKAKGLNDTYSFKDVYIKPDIKITTSQGILVPLRDIQTAVNLINILKDEGVV